MMTTQTTMIAAATANQKTIMTQTTMIAAAIVKMIAIEEMIRRKMMEEEIRKRRRKIKAVTVAAIKVEIVEEEEKNKNMSLFDRTMEGRRIQLIHTDDEYTKLKSGDLGTVQYSFKNLNDIVVQVKWDSGID